MASTQTSSSAPIPISRLAEITSDVCDKVFSSTTTYDHAHTSSQNTSIINTILQTLISESSVSGQPPQYKYMVTSTIIQQHATAASEEEGDSQATGGAVEGGEGGREGGIGKRGMHSASGAYWNNEKDGMWSFKYEKGGSRGFDVVVSIVWISVV
ncbi:hypothetical protein N7G274_006014 [Stereocaulon virgatum]|uniref:Dynein light chain n=1 Tax=Stereocaulon virgatum TaxID=373712 RepID=A0ABR4A7L1_9LECA